jgi:cell pole-organizing protein PopZ
MSGQTPGQPDPTMEDILASIRKILNEDDPPPAAASAAAPAPPAAAAPPPVAAGAEPLPLTADMMIGEPEPPEPAPEPVASAPPPPAPAPAVSPEALLAPAAATAAAAAIGSLARTVAEQRAASVHRGGPTIEDVVREEVRPILKEWLDTHLPPLVERLVRAEIERVVGRAVG